MDRITYRDEKNRAFYTACKNCDLPEKSYEAGTDSSCYGCYQELASCAKLADYEDAEEQGRLIEFPLAKGEKIYTIEPDGKITEVDIIGYKISDCDLPSFRVKCDQGFWTADIPVLDLDVIWFRDLEEAKKALKEGLYESH